MLKLGDKVKIVKGQAKSDDIYAVTSYSFDYFIHFKSGQEINGRIENSSIPPENIFLLNKMTYFADKKCCFYNRNEIEFIDISNLAEGGTQ